MSEAVRAAFAKQADSFELMRAPALAQLARVAIATLDRSTEVGRRVLDWTGEPLADALVLRLTGGLHALIRRSALPALAALYPAEPRPADAELAAALGPALAHPDLAEWLDGPPQTNEVARSAALYPGLLAVAAATGFPLSLRELGASAGLNLMADRFGYTLGGRRFGSPEATVQLAPHWTGAPPPAATLAIADRRGVDVMPLDPADPGTAERLLVYCWPEQRERVARLEAALALAAADPPPVDHADAADWVEAKVHVAPGVATVVVHSVCWQYFPLGVQRRITAHLAAEGARATTGAPLAWLRMEPDDPTAPAAMSLRLTLWPDGRERLLARVHPHGAMIAWLDG